MSPSNIPFSTMLRVWIQHMTIREPGPDPQYHFDLEAVEKLEPDEADLQYDAFEKYAEGKLSQCIEEARKFCDSKAAKDLKSGLREA